MTGEDVIVPAPAPAGAAYRARVEEHVLLSALESEEGGVAVDRDIGLDAALELLKNTPGEMAFLTTTEAADLARLSPRTLERMRGEGRGPRYCKIGGHGKRGRVVYPRCEVITWLLRGVRPA